MDIDVDIINIPRI